MKDIQMIRVMDMIKKSIQRNGSFAVSQIGKAIAKAEEAKAIKDAEKVDKALSLRHAGLALTPKQAITLRNHLKIDEEGNSKINKVFVCSRDDGDWDDDRLVRAKMNFTKEGHGEVVIEELEGEFDLDKNEKYIDGEITKEELFEELKKKQAKSSEDGPMDHGYRKTTAKLDDDFNFFVSSNYSYSRIF